MTSLQALAARLSSPGHIDIPLSAAASGGTLEGRLGCDTEMLYPIPGHLWFHVRLDFTKIDVSHNSPEEPQ